jgi:hypothetical protein
MSFIVNGTMPYSSFSRQIDQGRAKILAKLTSSDIKITDRTVFFFADLLYSILFHSCFFFDVIKHTFLSTAIFPWGQIKLHKSLIHYYLEFITTC